MTQPSNEDLIRRLITNLNNNYVHWDKFKDMQLPDPAYRLELWAKATLEREQGFYRRLSFAPFNIKWWISNGLESQLNRLDMNLGGGLDLQVLLDQRRIHRYQTSAILDESICSAQLAGIAVSKKAAREMLLKKRAPLDVNELICVNIHKALQQGYSGNEAALTEESLLQLHQTLTKDTIRPKGIGRYRTNNKVDLSAIDNSGGYQPVDAAKIPETVQQLLMFYNNDTEPFFIHPLVKAGLIHYILTSVRPFRDGNGRMARLLAQMYLLKKGYWVAGFISVSNVISKFRPQYHKSFAQSQSDEHNAGYFIQFYIQAVQMAYKSLKDFVLRVAKEKVETPKPKVPGYNERQSAVLNWLQEDADKMITIRELRSVYGVSKETARTDLTALVEKGWLKYYHINKKTYAFVKGEGFDAQVAQIV